ncbi:UDP-N-acetylmuramoyl-L-alanyl-D-glutamate--2,6-diaminopimelate ligase [Synechococcus sp. M16CYN]|uniref:UDP-N-acetylmuramoyl-L-alanyl-D-glutamate--2, 6-diaminopimelate ligase n=1 Tax=Synechococcus sp. M16CYN TaxID=3103139 RepID=UPI00324465AC
MTQMLHTLLRDVGLVLPTDGFNTSVSVKAVTSDSRMVGPGSLFVGLPGERVDGGIFWRQALQAGAVAAVIGSAAAAADPPMAKDFVVVVPDPVARTLGELAASFWNRPSERMALLGVTGTNGKTTITHLIEYLALSSGLPTAMFGTLVNRWSGHSATATHTTACADRLQAQLAEAASSGSRLAAMEISSHALSQNRVIGCRFAGAVFTNLTQDHLDYHASMEDYFETKALLFSQELLHAGAARAVVNSDDPWGAKLANRLSEVCWRSSLVDSTAELRMVDLTTTSCGVAGRLISPMGEGPFRSPLLGRFNLMNLLQAVGALLQQQLPLSVLLDAISHFRGVPGRMERVRLAGSLTDELPTVLIDYAHTPDGLKNALIAVRPFSKGRLICVFGCGGDRDRSKRPQMAAIAARIADRVVVTSDNPRTENPQRILDDVVRGIPKGTDLMVENDRAAAIAVAIGEAKGNDIVLIAGKGHEKYQLLKLGKVHFDDREEAEKALSLRLKP